MQLARREGHGRREGDKTKPVSTACGAMTGLELCVAPICDLCVTSKQGNCVYTLFAKAHSILRMSQVHKL